ncbi:MAG: phosphoribosylaminoimidazolesuccinocarboxamide synthase [candidate division WOR-3 bacterium]
MIPTVINTNFSELKLYKKGKVRDVYDLSDKLLIIATDRISAFDVVLNDGIPNKGIVLNELSCFWFNFTKDIIKNHLITNDVSSYPTELNKYAEILRSRSMLVKKTKPLPVECIVRGYISGSAWKEYLKDGSVSGTRLPKGLKESEKLPEPIFTPSTKAETGHDENISEQQMIDIVGKETTNIIKEACLKIYQKASQYAESRGIIIADTKMEFGLFDDKIILIDELLTPDSSRFWDMAEYQPGRSQNSFDKQYIRDYLESINWDKNPPAPRLPAEVIAKTAEKYQIAYKKILGK